VRCTFVKSATEYASVLLGIVGLLCFYHLPIAKRRPNTSHSCNSSLLDQFILVYVGLVYEIDSADVIAMTTRCTGAATTRCSAGTQLAPQCSTFHGRLLRCLGQLDDRDVTNITASKRTSCMTTDRALSVGMAARNNASGKQPSIRRLEYRVCDAQE